MFGKLTVAIQSLSVVLRECDVAVFVWHFGSTLPSTG